jgi:hypothetical protein
MGLAAMDLRQTAEPFGFEGSSRPLQLGEVRLQSLVWGGSEILRLELIEGGL